MTAVLYKSADNVGPTCSWPGRCHEKLATYKCLEDRVRVAMVPRAPDGTSAYRAIRAILKET